MEARWLVLCATVCLLAPLADARQPVSAHWELEAPCATAPGLRHSGACPLPAPPPPAAPPAAAARPLARPLSELPVAHLPLLTYRRSTSLSCRCSTMVASRSCLTPAARSSLESGRGPRAAPGTTPARPRGSPAGSTSCASQRCARVKRQLCACQGEAREACRRVLPLPNAPRVARWRHHTPAFPPLHRTCLARQERNATLPRAQWEEYVERSFAAVQRRLPALRFRADSRRAMVRAGAGRWWLLLLLANSSSC